MNNPILIVGHAALPSNLCSGIIDMHEQAPFTELKSMEDDGHVEPMNEEDNNRICLLYTSPSPRDQRGSRMPSSA